MAVRLEHANLCARDLQAWVRFLQTAFSVSSARKAIGREPSSE
jgi:hypothetical protein